MFVEQHRKIENVPGSLFVDDYDASINANAVARLKPDLRPNRITRLKVNGVRPQQQAPLAISGPIKYGARINQRNSIGIKIEDFTKPAVGDGIGFEWPAA